MVCLSMCQFYISNSGLRELFSLIGCVEPFSLQNKTHKKKKSLVLLFFFHSACALIELVESFFSAAMQYIIRLDSSVLQKKKYRVEMFTFSSDFSSTPFAIFFVSFRPRCVCRACSPVHIPIFPTDKSFQDWSSNESTIFFFSSFKRCAQSQRMSHLFYFPSEFLTQILVEFVVWYIHNSRSLMNLMFCLS